MKIRYTLCLAAAILLVAPGCDSLYDEINENLPAITVGDGVLGLNGEAGAEMTGGFTAEAGKTGAASSTATFTVENAFNDYGATNFRVTEISTQVGIAISNGSALTVSRTGDSLPEVIPMRGFSFGGTVSDSQNSFTFPGLTVASAGTQGGDFGFRRSSCTTSGGVITCSYTACIELSANNCYSTNRTTTAVLADRVRILSMTGRPAALTVEQSTERLLQIITEQDGSNTPNTGRFTFSFTTPVDASELAGATASIGFAEVDTQVETEIL